MKFAVHAPPGPGRSAGVRALHRLADELLERGHGVERVPLEGGGDPAAVHVYPEIVTGNPAGASRVVRWALNTPGRLTGREMGEGPDDLVVTWHPLYRPGVPVLRVPLIERQLFYPKTRPGAGVLSWVYKGQPLEPDEMPGAREVTFEWPATRAELADELRAAEVLYSCDPFSSLNDEAVVCGTPVLFSRAATATLTGLGFERARGMAYHVGELPLATTEALLEGAARHDAAVAGAAGDVDRFVEMCASWWFPPPGARSAPEQLRPVVMVPATRDGLKPEVLPAIEAAGGRGIVTWLETDDAYYQAMRRWWRESIEHHRDLIIVEHDIEVGPDTLRRFASCANPWCAHSYQVYWGDIGDLYGGPWGFGCVRFRWQFMADYPDAIEQAGEVDLEAAGVAKHARYHWQVMDSTVTFWLKGGNVRARVCRHRPNVTHHHAYDRTGAYAPGVLHPDGSPIHP